MRLGTTDGLGTVQGFRHALMPTLMPKARLSPRLDANSYHPSVCSLVPLYGSLIRL